MNAFITFLFFEIVIFSGPWNFFLEFWTLLNGSTSLDPHLQNMNKCISQQPTFLVYLHESWTVGKPYEIKLKCYWKRLKGITWELGEPQNNMMRTCWEHIGNKEEKQKITPPTLPRKEKKRPIMSTCWAFLLVAWNFYFQNSLSWFLARANGRGRSSGYLINFYFLLISWGCLTNVILIFFQWANLIGPSQKKVETMEVPKIEHFVERCSASPFGPPI